MRVQIIFKSKYACENEWKDKAALADWKKSHKIIRYVIPFIETLVSAALIYFFIFVLLPLIIQHFYNMRDIRGLLLWPLIAMGAFGFVMYYGVKMIGLLLRKLDLEGPMVKETPRLGNLGMKYEQYALVQPLLTSEENTPIVIAAAASFGFKSVRNQDADANPDCIILDFDREKILFPTQAAPEPELGE